MVAHFHTCSWSYQWPGSGVQTYGEKQWEQSIPSVHASRDGDLCNGPEVSLPQLVKFSMEAFRALSIPYSSKH